MAPQEQKKGQITIVARNIKGISHGQILEESKWTRNDAGGRHVQNGDKGGVIHNTNKERKPPLELKVLKVEGPFDPETNKIADAVEKGKKYNYKAAQYNRTPTKEELKNLKWGIKYDDGSIGGAPQVTGLEKISHFVSKNHDISKLRVYAYFKAPGENASVEAKIKVLDPIIIYICGYWNTKMPYAGTEWGEQYWGSGLKSAAKKYFKGTKEYFINGAGTKFSSGGSRFNQGREFAETRFKNTESKFYNEIFKLDRRIMIVSHSMGGAFAEGVLSVLKSHHVKVEKIVHLSPADTSGFGVNFPDRTYQIDIDWDPVLMYKNADDAATIKGVRFSGLVKNPKDDEFGHMYTKDEAFVWNWFEDLEVINFTYQRSEKKYMHMPSDGLGPSTTTAYTEKIYAGSGVKHNTQFKRVIKNNTVYHHHAVNEYENYQ
ncbi:hypothetical protein M2347_002508 [Chryseobacterium sp. H1D6B]|uniref:hypothetical protein n=1 Tax=Chryseobacterium sp. H1D6B TaxID=2940588 RepID=UPI0015C9161B|nr:hypothetical protein [Chryseobacterium sp. H1D6B]MDH6252781.1 hypothetical protein [Chryseobacterium sp. H1D6B]